MSAIGSFIAKLAWSFVEFILSMGRALGKTEARHEASIVQNERVAEANAARDDADAVGGMHDDPWNRDNRS